MLTEMWRHYFALHIQILNKYIHDICIEPTIWERRASLQKITHAVNRIIHKVIKIHNNIEGVYQLFLIVVNIKEYISMLNVYVC